MDIGTHTSPEFYACPNTHCSPVRVPILTAHLCVSQYSLTGEFSLLVVHLAAGTVLVSESASLILTSATVASLCVSTYIVVRQFPNPIAIDPLLRRD